MSEVNMKDKHEWATGGGLMLGVGVGFFLFEKSVFYFVGCIVGGLGLGLIISAILASRGRA